MSVSERKASDLSRLLEISWNTWTGRRPYILRQSLRKLNWVESPEAGNSTPSSVFTGLHWPGSHTSPNNYGWILLKTDTGQQLPQKSIRPQNDSEICTLKGGHLPRIFTVWLMNSILWKQKNITLYNDCFGPESVVHTLILFQILQYRTNIWHKNNENNKHHQCGRVENLLSLHELPPQLVVPAAVSPKEQTGFCLLPPNSCCCRRRWWRGSHRWRQVPLQPEDTEGSWVSFSISN